MLKIIFLFLLSGYVYAQYSLDSIVFSSKQGLKNSELTGSAVVIGEEGLEKKTNSRVTEVLNRAAGLDVVQTAPVGGQASLFLRGMESRHVLVLIDGVRVYDPTNADRGLNLATLHSLDIERIEVLKGAQSVLYGSDAISGVVNIITKKSSEKNSFTYGAGFFDQYSLVHSEDTQYGIFNIVASIQESEVDSVVADGSEKDFTNNKGFTLNHSFEKNRLEFNTVIKHNDNFNETDAQPAAGPEDDENSFARDIQTYFKEGITYHHNELVDVNLDLSYSSYNRINKYLSSSDYDRIDADGTILTGDFRIKEKLDDGHILYGINSVRESYEDNNISDQLGMFDVYALRRQQYGKHLYDYGARLTTNQYYGDHLVYSGGYNYQLNKEGTIKTSFHTGFKAPSIYQQQDPNIGNDELGPEKSVGLDVEYVYRTTNLQIITAVFQNQVDNSIQFANNTFNNVNNAKYSGLEFGFEIAESIGRVGANLSLTNYDLSKGKKAARRPNQVLKLDYLFNFTDEHSLGIDWMYRGVSYEEVNSRERELAPFDVWNMDYTFDADTFKIMGSFKNIFNRQYETIFGYQTLGANIQLTVVAHY